MQHGPRLTQKQYEQAIVGAYSELPARPDQGRLAEVGRRELDLTIDYRLGRDFPQGRRDALWQIQRRIEKKRLRLAASWLAALLVPSLLTRANRVAKFVVDEYAKVLTPEELEAYFGADEVARPSLPDDRGAQ